MATSTRVSGFSPAAHTDLFEREVREPMAALLDSPPEEYQPFKIFR
jgi:hypothetical protein